MRYQVIKEVQVITNKEVVAKGFNSEHEAKNWILIDGTIDEIYELKTVFVKRPYYY